MPIEVQCPDCQRRMRVPDSAAGKKIKCPKCAEGRIEVPAPKLAASSVPVELWHVQDPEGETYGPINKRELNAWHAAGRLTADWQILREGADQWQWASDLYPSLAGEVELEPADESPARAAGDLGENGFAISPLSSTPAEANPFSFAAQETTSVPRGGPRRGRGTSRNLTTSGGAVSTQPGEKSKIAAGLLGLFLGGWGIHRFYLGFTKIGIIQIVVTILTCGLGGLWGVIEGIMILAGKMNVDAQGRQLKD